MVLYYCWPVPPAQARRTTVIEILISNRRIFSMEFFPCTLGLSQAYFSGNGGGFAMKPLRPSTNSANFHSRLVLVAVLFLG